VRQDGRIRRDSVCGEDRFRLQCRSNGSSALQDFVDFVTSGGHNAGIVSPPGTQHRSYRMATKLPNGKFVDPDTWYANTPKTEGSWWTAWTDWLSHMSSGMVVPPTMGAPNKGLDPLCAAPGTYVLQR
jgi:polyhydroxyalkanoate synthase